MHAVSDAEVVEAVRKFWDLSSCPRPWWLALRARIADKNYVNLAKQRPQTPQCSFNTLTRVGARASHGGKIKDLGK